MTGFRTLSRQKKRHRNIGQYKKLHNKKGNLKSSLLGKYIIL